MRFPLAALLLILPAIADAQPARTADHAIPPALPPIGLPLPRIGLPLPPIGLAPATPTPTDLPRGADTGRTRRDWRGDAPHVRPSPPPLYVVPAYVYGWSVPEAPTPGLGPSAAPVPAGSAGAATAPSVAGPPAVGTLRLDLQPRPKGQLFLDDAYVGTLDELGTEFTLLAGTHHLEIREPGFTPFALAVRIDDGRALVYRGELERAAAPARPVETPATAATPVPAAAPVARRPFYFIPGCYLGDVPPQDAGLPADCDPRRVVIFHP